MYEESLLAAPGRIQDHIPAGDLAVQWDVAQELAYLEDVASRPRPAWFTPVKDGILQRVLRLAAAVDEGVALSFHLCYGDLGHRHFVEPTDTAVLVEVGNAILKGATRPVDWIHLTVPKSRADAAYFAPLKQLELGTTELYLGLLHPEDEEGRGRGSRLRRSLSERLGLPLSVG